MALFAAGGGIGDQLAGEIEREGLAYRRTDVAGATRMSVHVGEQRSGALYRFVMPGPELSMADGDSLLEGFSSLVTPDTLAVASGSLPAGLGEDFWARLADRANRAGCRLLLDTSSGIAAALSRGVFLLRQNQDEAINLSGKDMEWPQETADWAASLVRRGGCEIAVITHGAEGAIMVTGNARLHLAPPKVKAVSAVGAGDSFMGAFCFELARGGTPPEALRLAVAAAAAALLTPGTELARKEDIERLLADCPAPQPL
jgi:6-phosphofructokinase 2